MIVKYLLLVIISINVECKLEQVVSMFRHGARYHINSYYDGNSTKELWGELSAVGMRQHQNFGKMLRKDYIETLQFLSAQYTDKSIEVYSTDVNRTIESVRSQLYGLYPLGFGAKKLNVPKEYNIPPFSMSQDASDNTFSLPQGHLPFIVKINDSVIMTDCENWDRLVQANINSQKATYDQMYMTYLPFLRRVGQIFDIPEASMNFSKVSSLYDTLTVDRYLGRPLPTGLSEDDYLNMRHLHYWLNYFKINFDLSKAINTGKLKRVISDFDGRISNPKQQLKWTFLSAHDTDISGMLLDLNASSAQCVEQLYRYGKTSALVCDPAQEYVSNIIFELHSQNGQYNIRIRHDGVYLDICEQKSVSCPYQQWKNRVKAIILDDTDKVCKNKMRINPSLI